MSDRLQSSDGFVPKSESIKTADDVRLAVVQYCDENNLNYTLGTMHEMAKFATTWAGKQIEGEGPGMLKAGKTKRKPKRGGGKR